MSNNSHLEDLLDSPHAVTAVFELYDDVRRHDETANVLSDLIASRIRQGKGTNVDAVMFQYLPQAHKQSMLMFLQEDYQLNKLLTDCPEPFSDVFHGLPTHNLYPRSTSLALTSWTIISAYVDQFGDEAFRGPFVARLLSEVVSYLSRPGHWDDTVVPAMGLMFRLWNYDMGEGAVAAVEEVNTAAVAANWLILPDTATHFHSREFMLIYALDLQRFAGDEDVTKAVLAQCETLGEFKAEMTRIAQLDEVVRTSVISVLQSGGVHPRDAVLAAV